MRKDIHPKFHETKVTCVCGNVIEVGSTVEDQHVEICSNCHPYFTGRQKLVDTAGRVERYRKKYGIAAGDDSDSKKSESDSDS